MSVGSKPCADGGKPSEPSEASYAPGEPSYAQQIAGLALFGSFLRGETTAESDIDLLVTFDPDADWSLFDFVALQEELSRLFGHKVDLVSRRGLERSKNPIRPKEILATAKVIYAFKG